MVTTSTPKRKNGYDQNLLVELVAEGRLGCRKIAEKVGISPTMVAAVARGARRPDLYERICETVEAAHRRARRIAADNLAALVTKHVEAALTGNGETGRKCREFLIRMCLTTPDLAGRYVGQGAGPNAARATRDERTLLAALRGGPGAPTYKSLPARMQSQIESLMPKPPVKPQLPAIADFLRSELHRTGEAARAADKIHWALHEEFQQLDNACQRDEPPTANSLPPSLQDRLEKLPDHTLPRGDKPLGEAILARLGEDLRTEMDANLSRKRIHDSHHRVLTDNWRSIIRSDPELPGIMYGVP